MPHSIDATGETGDRDEEEPLEPEPAGEKASAAS